MYLSPFAIHPGESLKDLMKSHNLSKEQFAKEINMDIVYVRQLLSGKYPIGNDIAKKLEKVFGTSAKFWISLQENYANTLYRLNKR